MIRNLKVLLAAALALTAFGAIAASAHAADEFHCSAASITECRGNVKADGTGTTAHHVFIVENAAKTESVSFTCTSLGGTAEFISATDVSLTWSTATGEDRTAYKECKVNGSPGVVVHMNGCTYTFTGGAGGTTEPGTAQVHILCPTGQVIEVTLPSPSTCVFRIAAQTLDGIGYHNIGSGATREVTVTATVNGTGERRIAVTTGGNCEAFIKPGQELTGTYTTGNTIVTAQTAAGAMLEGWFE